MSDLIKALHLRAEAGREVAHAGKQLSEASKASTQTYCVETLIAARTHLKRALEHVNGLLEGAPKPKH